MNVTLPSRSETLQLSEKHDRLAWLQAEVAEADAEVAQGELVDWTPCFMERLKRESDEDERNGGPILDHVSP